MLAGGIWAGIAGVLKVYRGVSEVISTIMLNAIMRILVAFLLRKVAFRTEVNVISTRPLPEESQVPGIQLIPGVSREVYGLLFLASSSASSTGSSSRRPGSASTCGRPVGRRRRPWRAGSRSGAWY